MLEADLTGGSLAGCTGAYNDDMNRRWLMIILVLLVLGAASVVVLNEVKRPAGSTITPQPSASGQASPAASGAPGPTGSMTPSPTLAVTGTAPDKCAPADLQLSVGPGGGAAGSIIYEVTLKNTSAKTCVLAGYPGVSLVDASGHQLAAADRNPGQAIGTVTLSSGHSTQAPMRMPNADNFGSPNPCSAASAKLRVYPPDATEFLEVAFSQRGCPGFSIDPVQ